MEEKRDLLERLEKTLSDLDEEELENLEKLIGKLLHNADTLEKGLDYFLAFVDLIEESSPMAKELYSEMALWLEEAEGAIQPGEIIQELKRYLDQSDY